MNHFFSDSHSNKISVVGLLLVVSGIIVLVGCQKRTRPWASSETILQESEQVYTDLTHLYKREIKILSESSDGQKNIEGQLTECVTGRRYTQSFWGWLFGYRDLAPDKVPFTSYLSLIESDIQRLGSQLDVLQKQIDCCQECDELYRSMNNLMRLLRKMMRFVQGHKDYQEERKYAQMIYTNANLAEANRLSRERERTDRTFVTIINN